MTATATQTIRFERLPMLEAIAAVSGVVPARSPKPILQNSLLVVDPDGGSLLQTTDLEVGIRQLVLGIKADAPARLVLPARFTSILRTCQDDEMTLTLEDENAFTIRGRKSKHKLPSEDPSVFPEVPAFDAADYHVIMACNVRKLIARTAFATDVESTRYALGGTLLEFPEGRASLVGTDGRRLALQVVPAEVEGKGFSGNPNPVIPAKALRLILKSITDDDPPVHLAGVANGSAILVRTERAEIYSRLVEGRFPRYQDVFPSSSSASCRFQVEPFALAVEQAAITTSEESRGADFRFDPERLVVTTNAADVGESEVELDLATQGGPVDITFDPRYLRDWFKMVPQDAEVKLEMTDGKNAAIFKVEDGGTYVVMPLTRDR
jgi:DNA polymerase-3 subunit beta